jgi:DNA-binding response OmpR family regulator
MYKVLIIEDNLEIRENTAEMLNLEGFSVSTANEGERGIELARFEKPDIILCDIMMPGRNGYEICAELKKDPLTAGIPVIFVSARTESKDKELGRIAGASAYLNKPFELNNLLETISACLK